MELPVKQFVIHQDTDWDSCGHKKELLKTLSKMSNQHEQVKDIAKFFITTCTQHYSVIFKTNLGNQKYLVEHEGDIAFFEDEGKVGLGFLTASCCFGQLWLNNKGSIGLKDEQRENRQLDIHLVSECCSRYHGSCSVSAEKQYYHVILDQQLSRDTKMTHV